MRNRRVLQCLQRQQRSSAHRASSSALPDAASCSATACDYQQDDFSGSTRDDLAFAAFPKGAKLRVDSLQYSQKEALSRSLAQAQQLSQHVLPQAGKRVRELEFLAAPIANLTEGSVIVRSGSTSIVVTVSKDPYFTPSEDSAKWLPLTVDVVQREAAFGAVPKNVLRTELRNDAATLVARSVDRSIRPCFDKRYHAPTHVVATVLSNSGVESDLDVLAINGASMALNLARGTVPFPTQVGAVKIALVPFAPLPSSLLNTPSTMSNLEQDIGVNISGHQTSFPAESTPSKKPALMRKNLNADIVPIASPRHEKRQRAHEAWRTGEYDIVVGPTPQECAQAAATFLMAGTRSNATMIEMTGSEVPSHVLDRVFEVASERISDICDTQREYAEQCTAGSDAFQRSLSPQNAPVADAAARYDNDTRRDALEAAETLNGVAPLKLLTSGMEHLSKRQRGSISGQLLDMAEDSVRRRVQHLPCSSLDHVHELSEGRLSTTPVPVLTLDLDDLVCESDSEDADADTDIDSDAHPNPDNAIDPSSVNKTSVLTQLGKLRKQRTAERVLLHNKRVDGRTASQIRELSAQAHVLPPSTVRGSAIFQRGETQVLARAAPAKADMLQVLSPLDPLNSFQRVPLLLTYEFPPYCNGEAGFIRGFANRRELGHGTLALRALSPLLDPPRTLDEQNECDDKTTSTMGARVVATVTGSNGSSSMATVCAASLALRAAGHDVPLVAGVAMGLVSQGLSSDALFDLSEYRVLTDIQGLEDYLGDMDFKVTGTARGFTAMQLDVKLPNGLPVPVLREALSQAHTAHLACLTEMERGEEEAKQRMNSSDATVEEAVHMWEWRATISEDYMGLFLGRGGSNIKRLRAEFDQVDFVVDDETRLTARHASRDVLESFKRHVQEMLVDGDEARFPEESQLTVRWLPEKVAGRFLHLVPSGETRTLALNDLRQRALESSDVADEEQHEQLVPGSVPFIAHAMEEYAASKSALRGGMDTNSAVPEFSMFFTELSETQRKALQCAAAAAAEVARYDRENSTNLVRSIVPPRWTDEEELLEEVSIDRIDSERIRAAVRVSSAIFARQMSGTVMQVRTDGSRRMALSVDDALFLEKAFDELPELSEFEVDQDEQNAGVPFNALLDHYVEADDGADISWQDTNDTDDGKTRRQHTKEQTRKPKQTDLSNAGGGSTKRPKKSTGKRSPSGARRRVRVIKPE